MKGCLNCPDALVYLLVASLPSLSDLTQGLTGVNEEVTFLVSVASSKYMINTVCLSTHLCGEALHLAGAAKEVLQWGGGALLEGQQGVGGWAAV
jgi:hypothetical protein